MATKIVTKNSSTASAVPTASDLVQGELAVNVADKRLFTEDNAGAIVELGTNPSGNVTFQDNGKAIFGAGSDLQIYHDGSNSYIDEAGQGTLYVRADSATTIANPSNTLSARFRPSTSVSLYYNGVEKLATTSTGIDVTGTATMDGLTVDGRTDLRGGATPLGVYRTLALAVDTQSEIVLGSQDLSNNYVDAAKIRGLLKANKTEGEISLYTLSSSTLTPRLNIAANGDISFYEDTGTTPKLFWDASAEALAVGGTNTFTSKIVASAANGTAYTANSQLRISGGGTNNNRASILFSDDALSDGKISYYPHATESSRLLSLSARTTESDFVITGSGNVGIGTSSPSKKAHLYASNDSAALRLENTANSKVWDITPAIPGVANTGLSIHNVTDDRVDLHVDNSGNVGIGTSNPNSYAGQTTLNINSAAVARLDLDIGDTMQGYLLAESGYTGLFTPSGSNSLRFGTNNTERMRIDSSGNLLVGKTATALGTAGHTFGNDGYLYHTRSGDIMWLNRLGGHGTCITFMKDSATVGTISTNASSLPSDRNFKKNIQDLTLGLNFVESLNPVTYNYKIDDEGQAVMTGLIAQEVEEALTAAGVEKNSMTLLQHTPTEDVNESDYQMDYLKFVPILINSIKEQQTLIESLTARIAALEE